MLSFGILLSQLTPQAKALTRKLEREEKKLVNCTSGVSFLKTCINENLLPKFTDIYIYIYIIYAGLQEGYAKSTRHEFLLLSF